MNSHTDPFTKVNLKQGDSISVFHNNSLTCSKDQRGKLDCSCAARKTQDYAPLQRQATNDLTSPHDFNILN